MNIYQAIKNCTDALEDAGIESAHLDAEVLAAHALGTDRADLYLRQDESIDDETLAALDQAVARRSDGCPVAYITGVKEFWSIPMKVREGVLIPRPDTETLVEEALRISRDTDGDSRILDLCTGSGCIAAALAKEIPGARITVTDISGEALDTARENLSFAGGRVEFLSGDLFAAIEDDRQFEMIVTNPPYIRDDELATLPRDIADFEPRGALAAGKSGLDFIRRIIEDAPRYLVERGWLVMEIGQGQAEAAAGIAIETDRYDTIRTAKDLAGIDRVISLRRS